MYLCIYIYEKNGNEINFLRMIVVVIFTYVNISLIL